MQTLERKMRTEKFEFLGHSGEMLAARLDAPDQAPRAYGLFAHCFTCTKDIYAASRIARALTETVIAVVRFDFTGLGHSDGNSPTPTSPPMSKIWLLRQIICVTHWPRRT
jgi:hypothetical protein